MPESDYSPMYVLTRGETVESIHYGSAAVVSADGKLIAWYGNPNAVAFLRSTAKPFQALPFLENGGDVYYGLSAQEIAITCASHTGTDQHLSVVSLYQQMVGVPESELLCGAHMPSDVNSARALRDRDELPTPNYNNCSGKHTGMLAYAKMMAANGDLLPQDMPYIDFSHPVQTNIRKTVAEICGLAEQEIKLGIDGCSAPNFAIPLQNTALGFARLCDPEIGGVQSRARAAACRKVTRAMQEYPVLVRGPGRFDTALIETGKGRLISKGGAEGYYGIGLLPGVLRPGSPGVGIAIKISDGDPEDRAGSAVALDILTQLGVFSADDLSNMAQFGPIRPVYNWRKIVVGQGRPVFSLRFAGE